MAEITPERRPYVLGFTGTQIGMTPEQAMTVAALLDMYQMKEAHHGDCIGADADFHDMAVDMGARTVAHPPLDPKKRAFKQADVILPAKDYLKRNQDIVAACSVLIAAPKGYTEELRSGTWTTIRHARRLGRHHIIVYPDGMYETIPAG